LELSSLFSLMGFSEEGVKRILKFIDSKVSHLTIRNWIELFVEVHLTPERFIAKNIVTSESLDECFYFNLTNDCYRGHLTGKVKVIHFDEEEKFNKWVEERLEEDKKEDKGEICLSVCLSLSHMSLCLSFPVSFFLSLSFCLCLLVSLSSPLSLSLSLLDKWDRWVEER
jgi:hypothetical protein